MSILYRNAVWALQAGKFKGSIGIQSLHTQVRFWEEKQSLSSGLAPVQTTTEASAQGWEVLRLESLILRAAPSCLLVESTQVLGPHTLSNSCVLSPWICQWVRVIVCKVPIACGSSENAPQFQIVEFCQDVTQNMCCMNGHCRTFPLKFTFSELSISFEAK